MTDIIVGFIDMMEGWVQKLPDLSIETGHLSMISDAMETVIAFISKVNYIIPVNLVLLLLSLVYGFKLIKFALFLANWVICRITELFP